MTAMMGALFQGGGFLLGAGLLIALAALVYALLRTNRPDPKMIMFLALLNGLPKSEKGTPGEDTAQELCHGAHISPE